MLPYIGIAAKQSLQYKPVEMSLRFEDREVVVEVLFVTVANIAHYGGGAIIAPDADPTDGLLDVVVVKSASALEMLLHTPKLFDGSFDQADPVEIYPCRSVRILRSEVGPIHIDGDPHEAGAVLNYSVNPRSLRVRVSESFRASGEV